MHLFCLILKQRYLDILLITLTIDNRAGQVQPRLVPTSNKCNVIHPKWLEGDAFTGIVSHIVCFPVLCVGEIA